MKTSKSKSVWDRSEAEVAATKVWYDHYWQCELCKSNHTKLVKPAVHPCYEGYHLREKYHEALEWP